MTVQRLPEGGKKGVRRERESLEVDSTCSTTLLVATHGGEEKTGECLGPSVPKSIVLFPTCQGSCPFLSVWRFSLQRKAGA